MAKLAKCNTDDTKISFDEYIKKKMVNIITKGRINDQVSFLLCYKCLDKNIDI